MIHDATHTLLQKALEVIRVASSGRPFPTRAALARATGESEANISRWLSGASTPTLKKLEPILLRLGVRFCLPSDVPPPPLVLHLPTHISGENIPFSFRAIALMGETGTLSTHRPESPEWLLAQKGDADEHTVALRVSAHDRSMLPSLHPGDTVLIDRTASTAPNSKDIYLVQVPPAEGTGWLLRRVCLKHIPRDTQIMFYADNACEGFMPSLHLLSHYPDKALSNVLYGRVTHIWADVRTRQRTVCFAEAKAPLP